MTLDLDHLDALANAASPGPWSARETLLLDPEGITLITSDFGHSCADIYRREDAAFMVAARESVPQLVARVRELEAENPRLGGARPAGSGAAPDLDGLEALASAASPAPWVTNGSELWDRDGGSLLDSDFGSEVGELSLRDAAFVAAARQGMPALVARVRELEAAKSGVPMPSAKEVVVVPFPAIPKVDGPKPPENEVARRVHEALRDDLERIRARFSSELHALPDGRTLVLHDGGESATAPGPDLGLLAKRFSKLEDELRDRVLVDKYGPTFPRDRTSPVEWDLFWFTKLGDELHSFDKRAVSDSVGELDVLRVRRWQNLGLRSILLAGSGASLEPRHLAALGFDVTALDISPLATTIALLLPDRPDLLAAAFADRFPQPARGEVEALRRPGGRARYAIGDIADPHVLLGPYDVVVARRTVQCTMPDHLVMLDCLLARLRPGGHIFVHEHNNRRRRDEYVAHLVSRGRTIRTEDAPTGDTELWFTSG